MASTDMGPQQNIGKSRLFETSYAAESVLTRSLDFSAYEALVDATHRYHEIFYEKQN
jgi:hypothetical protein